VHLVDEQDDAALGRRDLIEHGLEPFLELAAIFRAGDQTAHVERQDLLVAQAFGHVAVDDAQGQALDDGGLADAGFADQDGVVLGAAGQHLDGAADLFVATDDGVDLAVAGGLGQVAGVAFQGVIAVFGAGAVGGLALADLDDGGVQRVRLGPGGGQDGGGDPAFAGEGAEQTLGGDEGVAGLLGRGLGGGEDAGGVAVEIELARAAGDLGALAERGLDVGFGALGVAPAAVIRLRARPSRSSSSTLSKCSGANCWWRRASASDWAD
jgi:hypothetical protein